MGARKNTPSPPDSKKSKPSEADLRAAARLKRIWDSIPRKNRPSQEEIGGEFDPIISQSGVSQYLNGGIALNFTAVLIFAYKLGCSMEDIRDDLQEFELLRRIGWRSPDARAASAAGEVSKIKPMQKSAWPFSADSKAQFDGLHPRHKLHIQGVLEDAIAFLASEAVHRPPRNKRSHS